MPRKAKKVLTDEDLEAAYRLERTLAPPIEDIRDAWLDGADVTAKKFFIDPTLSTGFLIVRVDQAKIDREQALHSLMSCHHRYSNALRRSMEAEDHGFYLLRMESIRLVGAAWRLWRQEHKQLLLGADFGSLPAATKQWAALRISGALFWITAYSSLLRLNRISQWCSATALHSILAFAPEKPGA